MYLAVLATGGLFSFVWILLLMRDLNLLEQKTIFPVKLYVQMMVPGLIVYFFGVLLLMSSYRWGLLLPLTMTLGIALELFLFVSLARVSMHVTKALGYGHHAAHALVVILLMFVCFVSSIVLQRRMNALIALRAHRGIMMETMP